MTATREHDRYRWLMRHGRNLLDNPSLARVHGLADWQSAMLEQQLALRRRSRHRFPVVERWLWTDRSLSQASDYWCAKYKASLFPVRENVVDACCGAGSDLVALAQRGEAKGIDLNPILAELAENNVRAHGLSAEVSRLKLPDDWAGDADWLHVDPDRRPEGLRTTHADSFDPPLEAVLNMARDAKGAAVKLAPSTHISPQLSPRVAEETERIWLGNQGECRQQLLVTGLLKSSTPHNRQAILCEPAASSESNPQGVVLSTDVELHRYSGNSSAAIEIASQPLRYVYDLHNLLHASELQNAWGLDQGMRCLGGEHGYFTSDQIHQSPWTRCFEVLDCLAWDDRKVRKWLRGFNAGSVEVKCRLMKMDANAWQRRYSQASGNPVTLLVTCLGKRTRALIARRLG